MIPIIYDKNEIAFTSNGLGRLYDCISCIVTEERNGVYECEFQYPISGENYSLIQVGRIIAVTHDDTEDVQPFDIIGFDKPIDGIVTFHAVHISYRLRKATTVPTAIEGTPDARSAFLTAEPPNNFNYHFFDEPRYDHVAAADGLPHTVKELLGGIEGSLLDTFGGEFKFDKFDVYLLDARGVPRNITVRYGVNMIEYNDEVDTSEAYSSCIPYWTGGTPVIGDRVDSAGTTPSGRIECVPLDLTDKFKNQPTKAQLESRALKYMTKNNTYLATQSIEISFMPLQDYGLIEPGPPGLIYVLTADANGGSIPETEGWTGTGASASKEVAVGEPYGLLPAPTLAGYLLNGWYDDPVSGTQVDEFTAMGESDTTIYAHWTAETYITTFFTDGTFIINEPQSQRAANIAAHGAVLNEYSGWDGNVNNYVFSSATERPWNSIIASITKVIIGQEFKPTSTAYWFQGGTNITEYDLSKLNTSNTTSMAYMFSNNSKVTRLDISSFATPNVLDTQYMFQGCSKLINIIAMDTFVTSQITSSTYMFQSCSLLYGGAGTPYSSSYRDKARAKIDKGPNDKGYFTLGGAVTTVLYNDYALIINEPKSQRAANIATHGAIRKEYNALIRGVFDYNFEGNTAARIWRNESTSITSVRFGSLTKPTNLTSWFSDFDACMSFDWNNLDTSDVTKVYQFMGAITGTPRTIDMRGLDVSNISDFGSMFQGSSAFTSINVSNWDTSNATAMNSLFNQCTGLTSLNLGSWATPLVTTFNSMFLGCTNLVTIYVSTAFDVSNGSGSDMFKNCTSLVGGAGTVFNSSYVSKSRAKIDGGPSDPGYFTEA